MTARAPLWTQAGTTSAEEDRAALALALPIRGVGTLTDLLVTQHGTPNMSVDVAAGRVVIAGTQSALQGRYVGWLDASLNVVISASDATNARTDLIVARVKDAQYSGASNTFSVEVVTGTPGVGAPAPTAPANSYTLATVTVAATVTTIVTGNIADNRHTAGPLLPSMLLVYPTSPAAGLAVYRKTNDVNEGLEIATSAGGFRKPWNMPWGVLPAGLAVQSSPGQTAIGTGPVDVTGVSLTNTFAANRVVRATLSGRLGQNGGGISTAWINDGTLSHIVFTANAASSEIHTFEGSYVFVTTAVTQTLKGQAGATGTGSGTDVLYSSTNPWKLVVEDLGPAGAPN